MQIVFIVVAEVINWFGQQPVQVSVIIRSQVMVT